MESARFGKRSAPPTATPRRGAAPGKCAAGAAGLDIIQFNVSGMGRSGGACTIAPNPALPAVTGPVLLDATTQPGYSGSPLIQMDWEAAPSSSSST